MKNLILVCGVENEKIESFVRETNMLICDATVVLYPENSSHPRVQIKNFKELVGNSGDLIIATHSEVIFNEVRLHIKNKLFTDTAVKIYFIDSLHRFTVNVNSKGKIETYYVGMFDTVADQLFELVFKNFF